MHHFYTKIHKFSIPKAHEAQLQLSQKISLEDRLPREINSIAGVDVAYTPGFAIGAVAVLDYKALELIEWQTAKTIAKFPYVPTLLSFREMLRAIACIRKLKMQPDVLLVDGQGIAHPYGCGFASHLGLAIKKPTIGVAKSRLTGQPTTIANQVLLIRKGQIIGAVVTTKEGKKPVYVSVGHLVSLETAVRIIKHSARNSRIPEPISKAHCIANKEKRRILTQKHKTL